jgi:hypothetical protein
MTPTYTTKKPQYNVAFTVLTHNEKFAIVIYSINENLVLWARPEIIGSA